MKQLHERGYANYTLVLKATGQKVGVCGLYVRTGMRLIDLGYALLPSTEGNGYARESSLRLMQAAKEDFDQIKLSAVTHPDNAASIKSFRIPSYGSKNDYGIRRDFRIF